MLDRLLLASACVAAIFAGGDTHAALQQSAPPPTQPASTVVPLQRLVPAGQVVPAQPALPLERSGTGGVTVCPCTASHSASTIIGKRF